MRNALSRQRASVLWIVLLTTVSTVTTLLLACATPFPALAALAAVHMRRNDGIALMLAALGASQLVGFLMLGYPHTASTLGWIPGLGTAAVASILAARAGERAVASANPAVRLAAACIAAFVAFKVVVLAWTLVLGGTGSVIDPAILARQFVRNGAILVGLYALYRTLVALGLPAPRRTGLAFA